MTGRRARDARRTPAERYAAKRAHYADPAVARDYDRSRWGTPGRRRSNRRMLRAVERAVAQAARRGPPIRSALDVPCGTGRLFPLLDGLGLDWAAADLSEAMLAVARESAPAARLALAEVEHLPFRDGARDAVLCIRFLFHLSPKARIRALVEMGRVARGWVVVDYRHGRNLRHLGRVLRWRLGLSPRRPHRPSPRAIRRELEAAGLEAVAVFPTAPCFTDKWVVLARASARDAAPLS